MFRALAQQVVVGARHGQLWMAAARPLATASAGPTDPIQKLFVEKLREYKKKQAGVKDGLVDATPEVMRDFTDAVERVERQFEAKGKDMSTFPKFEFKDPVLQSPAAGR